MVHQSSTVRKKLVHIEEGHESVMKMASINSGIYDLEEYSEEQRNHKLAMQDTFDDSVLTDDASFVDAKENPTQLYLRLHYRLWDMVATTLKSRPVEASIWISKNNQDKFLPIHVACESSQCPSNVVELLIDVYPQGLKSPTSKDLFLPLHLVCLNEQFLKNNEAAIKKMVRVWPQALKTFSRYNETPIDILRKTLATHDEPEYKRVLNVMEEKLGSWEEHERRARKRTENKTVEASSRKEHERRAPKRTENKTIEGSTSFHQTPSIDAADDGFASQLNKLRMAGMREKSQVKSKASKDTVPETEEAASISFRPSSDSSTRLMQAKPINDDFDDSRDHESSSSLSRLDGGERQFREQVVKADASSVLYDDDGPGPPQSAATQVNLKLAKTLQENSLLRKRLAELTSEVTTLRSSNQNETTLIHDLKQSVEREREISKNHVRDYELKLARMEDQVVDCQRQVQYKVKNEREFAQRISQLESIVAGKKADLSTIRIAMKEGSIRTAVLEEELEQHQSENKTLSSSMASHVTEKEALVERLEEVSKEFAAYKEAEAVNKTNVEELSNSLTEKAIQMRSLTESIRIGDQKRDKLEKLNTSLKTKATDLKDILKSNTETFKATIAKMEKEIQKKEEEERETLRKVEELQRIFVAKERQIERLTSETKLLEDTCESLRQKDLAAQEVARELKKVSSERSQLHAQLQDKKKETESLSKEVDAQKTESQRKESKLQETERRIDALYTELTAQRKRETELEHKNTEMKKQVNDLSLEQQNKAAKLRILKTAVEKYKKEMDKFISEKSDDDKTAVQNVQKLVETEKRLGSESVKAAELAAKLANMEEKEQASRSLAEERSQIIQDVEAQLDEAKSQGKFQLQEANRQAELELKEAHNGFEKERKTANELLEEALSQAEQSHSALEDLRSVHVQQTVNLQTLQLDHQKLQDKAAVIEDDYKQLEKLCDQNKVLAEEKVRIEEDLRAETKKLRDYNRLQTSLVEDQERSLSKLRSEHAELGEEFKQMKFIAGKREDLNAATDREREKFTREASDRIKELETSVSGLKQELEIATSELEKAQAIDTKRRQDVETQAGVVKAMEQQLSVLNDAKVSEAKRVQELFAHVTELKKVKTDKTKRIHELEVTIDELREWYSNALTQVSNPENTRDMTDPLSVPKSDIDRMNTIIATMREEKTLSNDTIGALQQANTILQREIKELRISDTQGTKAVELLTNINAENLLRIKFLSEKETWAADKLQETQDLWKAQEQEQNRRIEELEKSMKMTENDCRKEVVDAKAQIEEQERMLDNLKNTLKLVQENFDDVQEELTETTNSKTSLRSEFDSFVEKDRKQTIQLDSYQAKIEILETTIEQLRGTLQEQNAVIGLRTTVSSELSGERAMLQKRVSVLSNELSDERAKLKDLERVTDDIKKEKDSLKEVMDKRVDVLSKEIGEERERLEKINHETNELKQERDSSNMRVGVLSKEIEEERERLEKINHETNELKQERDSLKEEVDRLAQELDKQRETLKKEQTALTEVLNEERDTRKSMVDDLTEKVQTSRDDCTKLETQLRGVKKEGSELTRKLKSLEGAAQSAEGWKAEQARLLEHNNILEEALSTSVDRCESLQKEVEELKTLQTKEGGENEQAMTSLTKALDDLQKELHDQGDEFKKCEDLNKSYQIEVGRLLKVNVQLGEDCLEIKEKADEQANRVKELIKFKEESERQAVASSKRVLEILSKFSPDATVSELEHEKRQLQKENEIMAEDNLANSANVEYLMTNIELLETRVQDLTSTHRLLHEEADGMRKTMTEQSERIFELIDVIKEYKIIDKDGGVDKMEPPILPPTGSFEWDVQLLDVVARYTGLGEQPPPLSPSQKNRSARREALRRRVNQALENQNTTIKKLRDQLRLAEIKVAECEKRLEDVRAVNQTIKLENKILKTAGKERDQRAKKMHSKLKEENVSLKQAIGKLTKQTADHQLKIRRLAAKQASLQRKKESATMLHQRSSSGTIPAFEPVVRSASCAPPEDLGSLAFSADSQDVLDEPASNGFDRNVEVVLVDEATQESRDQE